MSDACEIVQDMKVDSNNFTKYINVLKMQSIKDKRKLDMEYEKEIKSRRLSQMDFLGDHSRFSQQGFMERERKNMIKNHNKSLSINKKFRESLGTMSYTDQLIMESTSRDNSPMKQHGIRPPLLI